MGIERTSYTGRDFDSIRKEIVELIPGITDRWTDFNESGPEMAFISALAHVGDMLSFYLDQQALECYLPTVLQKKNMRAILSLVGYKFKRVASALTTLRFSVNYHAQKDIIIPKYTVVSTDFIEDNHYFVTRKSCKIKQGESSVEVIGVEGVKQSLTVTYSDLENSIYIPIPSKRVPEASVRVIVDGEEWEEDEDIFMLLDSKKAFSCYEDNFDNLRVAIIPTWKDEGVNEGSQIEIQYLISSGADVSLNAGVVTEVLDEIKDIDENVIEVGVINTERVAGGAERETIDLVRQKAPREVRTMWTAVTLEDYRTLAESVPGVRKATAIDWKTPGNYIQIPYYIKIYIVPEIPPENLTEEEKETLFSSLRSIVLDYINERKPVTIGVTVHPPEYNEVDVNVKIFVERNIVDLDDLKFRVIKAIKDYFSVEKQEFGYPLRFSRFVSMIHSVDRRIVYTQVNSPEEDIVNSAVEFFVLRDLSIEVEEIL